MKNDTSMTFGLDVISSESSNYTHLKDAIPNTEGIQTKEV